MRLVQQNKCAVGKSMKFWFRNSMDILYLSSFYLYAIPALEEHGNGNTYKPVHAYMNAAHTNK
jgi:hypothetical protein